MPESINAHSCSRDLRQVTSPLSTSGVLLGSMNIIRELIELLGGFNEVIHVSAHYMLLVLLHY